MNYQLLSLLVVSLTGCSSSPPMDPDPIDSASIVLNAEDIDKYWNSHKKVAPIFPTREMRSGVYSCINVLFVIGEDGLVHSPKVIAAFPKRNKHFEKASITAVKKFIYTASAENESKERVITSNVFTFFVTADRSSTEEEKEFERKLESTCKVDLTSKASGTAILAAPS